jgi:hypothetical protein
MHFSQTMSGSVRKTERICGIRPYEAPQPGSGPAIWMNCGLAIEMHSQSVKVSTQSLCRKFAMQDESRVKRGLPGFQ